MTQIGKYLLIDQQLQDPKRKTHTWHVLSARSGDVLGTIKWYGPWRQYCFEPAPVTTFNKECLGDIANFMDHEMEIRRQPTTMSGGFATVKARF